MQERARDMNALMLHEARRLRMLSRLNGLVLGLGGASIDALRQDYLRGVRFEAAGGLDLILPASIRTLHSFVLVNLATKR